MRTRLDHRRMATACALAAGLVIAIGSVAAAQGLASAEGASVVRRLSGPALSPRLLDLPDAPPTMPWRVTITPAPQPLPLRSAPFDWPHEAGAAQRQKDPPPAVTNQASFTGITFNGSIPPDPNIAVGQSYTLEAANGALAVFTKDGNPIGGPKAIWNLWSGSGITECSSSAVASSNDAIVQYDNLAPDSLNDGGTGRWLITEPGDRNAPSYSECIAVSVTSDPTGPYYLYADTQFGGIFNDYPKFGVWPTASNSAYLASYNLTQNGTSIGSDLCAYNRDAMLRGVSAPSPAVVCSMVPNDGNFLPADLDGGVPPNDGTPGYFLNFETKSSLRLYQLSLNFALSPPTAVLSPPFDIPVAPFTAACVGGCVPQPATKVKLEALGDRLMYRLAYRMLGGTTPTMVVNHSVVAGSSIGVRWYELRPTASGPFGVYQYGTFSPNSAYRWMGSMAMDRLGDIALGYSESSARTYPEIAYTGRTPDMTLGTMGAEAVLKAGGGSQTGSVRWGDYTAMRIDPSDDCTFWYTNEYYPKTSSSGWSTAIGKFQSSTCH
ncbi:MAG TPA: hypothetical protein VJ770_17760 [Stellaceae bacterium]|nr:hypothetical protein [Stellaceae bacterium]